MKKGWLWKILMGAGAAAIAAGGAVLGIQKYKERNTLSDEIELIDGDKAFPDDPDKVSGEVVDSEE